MNDLYLILHKVRGEPAFDIAQRLDRPHDLYKTEDNEAPDVIKDQNGEVVLGLCKICGRGEIQLEEQCDGEDVWIIPTSGHRAYPCFAIEVGQIVQEDVYKMFLEGNIAPELPDHYKASEPRAVPAVRRIAAKPTTTDDFLI